MAFLCVIGSWILNMVSCGKTTATVAVADVPAEAPEPAPIENQPKISEEDINAWMSKNWGAQARAYREAQLRAFNQQVVEKPILDVSQLGEKTNMTQKVRRVSENIEPQQNERRIVIRPKIIVNTHVDFEEKNITQQ